MANVCMYDMKIAGREESVKEFMQMVSREGSYKDSSFGRVFTFEQGQDPIEHGPQGSGLIFPRFSL